MKNMGGGVMVGVTSLVVVDGSLVAHGADGGHFPEGGEVVHADWPAAHGHLSLGLERLPTDGELVERRHVSRRPRRLFEHKHLNKPTHITSSPSLNLKSHKPTFWEKYHGCFHQRFKLMQLFISPLSAIKILMSYNCQ